MNPKDRSLSQRIALRSIYAMLLHLNHFSGSDLTRLIANACNTVGAYILSGEVDIDKISSDAIDRFSAMMIVTTLETLEKCTDIRGLEKVINDLIKDITEKREIISRQQTKIYSLSDCVLDGIEKNYSSWEDWSSVAKQIYKNANGNESNH